MLAEPCKNSLILFDKDFLLRPSAQRLFRPKTPPLTLSPTPCLYIPPVPVNDLITINTGKLWVCVYVCGKVEKRTMLPHVCTHMAQLELYMQAPLFTSPIE